ncbi:purine permease, partial [Mesorhizobium sp. M00.F.Ca.ET.186.01.1.1]
VGQTSLEQLPTLAKMMLQNGIVTGSLTAVILNILLVHTNKKVRQAPVPSTVSEAS